MTMSYRVPGVVFNLTIGYDRSYPVPESTSFYDRSPSYKVPNLKQRVRRQFSVKETLDVPTLLDLDDVIGK